MRIVIQVLMVSGSATITWTTFDQNGNQIGTGTAATLALACSAAVTSLKANITSQVTALGGVS